MNFDPRNQCSLCFANFERMYKHRKICKNKSLSRRLFTCLTYDTKTFLCQFGCNLRVSTLQDLYKHWFDCHTYDELKRWCINKDLLADWPNMVLPKVFDPNRKPRGKRGSKQRITRLRNLDSSIEEETELTYNEKPLGAIGGSLDPV